MEMGEFANFRRPLLIILPVGFILVLRFVDEFLAVRALGILCLLAAEPLLDAAFLRPETSRLLVTVLAYLMIVAGLIWVTMPYLLRDQINWSTKSRRDVGGCFPVSDSSSARRFWFVRSRHTELSSEPCSGRTSFDRLRERHE